MSRCTDTRAALLRPHQACRTISPPHTRRARAARPTWNAAPSTSPNSATTSQAWGSVGALRPDRCAHSSSTAPAGMSRQEATSRGVVWGASCFMATMLVPQKKKGEMSSNASSSDSGPAAGRGGAPAGWGFALGARLGSSRRRRQRRGTRREHRTGGSGGPKCGMRRAKGPTLCRPTHRATPTALPLLPPPALRSPAAGWGTL